jgi:hypothetical protein
MSSSLTAIQQQLITTATREVVLHEPSDLRYKVSQRVTQHSLSVSFICFSELTTKLYLIISKKVKYWVIQNDCRGFNNLSYTIHLR